MELVLAISPILQIITGADPTKRIADLNAQLEIAESLPENWMSSLLPYIGSRSIDTICLPRSHDAGLYKLRESCRLGSLSTVVTQTRDIFTQLKCGVRMFDIRPIIRHSQFVCGHYQYVKSDQVPSSVAPLLHLIPFGITDRYHGGDGALLQEVIDQVNQFTASHNELIILEISHTFNFDREKVGEEWGHLLNQKEWEMLFAQLAQLKNLYIMPNTPGQDNRRLVQRDINDLLAGGSRSAVILAIDHNNLGDFAGRGFYQLSELNSLRHRYVTREQNSTEAIVGYLRDNLGSVAELIIQSLADSFDSEFIRNKQYSITDVARVLRTSELPHVPDEATSHNYPNTISMDSIEDAALASVAMAVIGKVVTSNKVGLKSIDGKWTFV